ncbi:class I SAM-dependent methyltransferase [Streptosporangium carneum]|uniref:Methyltransferase n=1 Tax=Streptosporangium carneum TaxID=47481 RepID=A0A9W6MG65_9ACTN|nr:class I SAM-dependent methyltransferase [Streptosporangium carneum]GLK12598.1 methyltransferase [Streptosporangium carneum]
MSAYYGSGPGDITPDGCAVEFYSLLPPMGEPEIVHAAVPADASILELGCGTGRILRPLAELGHPVLGVDESPAMLARVAELPTVRASIETLRLDRAFDAVLLASTMLNADSARRRAFLQTCRRHVDPHGVVIVQRAEPSWFDTVEPSVREHDGIRRVIKKVHRDGPRVDVVIDYHVGDQTWTHAFSRHPVDERELAADLASARLRLDRWLTDDRTWFAACPETG